MKVEKATLTIQIDKEIEEKVRIVAKRGSRSVSKVINLLIKKHIDEMKKEVENSKY